MEVRGTDRSSFQKETFGSRENRSVNGSAKAGSQTAGWRERKEAEFQPGKRCRGSRGVQEIESCHWVEQASRCWGKRQGLGEMGLTHAKPQNSFRRTTLRLVGSKNKIPVRIFVDNSPGRLWGPDPEWCWGGGIQAFLWLWEYVSPPQINLSPGNFMGEITL